MPADRSTSFMILNIVDEHRANARASTALSCSGSPRIGRGRIQKCGKARRAHRGRGCDAQVKSRGRLANSPQVGSLARPSENHACMTEKRVQRRLAAILAADVVGYSRMIETDEGGRGCVPCAPM